VAWLTGWGYRKSHVINYAAGAGTLYQKQITVHYGSGTDGDDDVYLNSHSRTDFGDVRFTDDDGTTLLDYWMESKVDSDYAIFWVEVADDLSTVAATIYVYYGKADATTTSNGINTFIFFEDFNALSTGELNGQNAWAGTTNRYAVQTSVVKEGAKAVSTTSGADAAGIKHDVTVTAGRMFVQAYLRSPAISTQYSVMVKVFEGTTEITGVFLSVSYEKHLYAAGEESIEAASSDTWYKCKLAFDSLTTHKIWIDDVLKSLGHNTNETNIVTTVTKVSIQEYYNTPSGVQGYIDLLIVGKYVYPEPAHGSWGNEETSAVLKEVTDSISLSDAVSVNKNLVVTDSLSMADSVLRNKPLVEVLDSLSLSDVVLVNKTVSVQDVLSIADAVSVNTGVTLKEVLDTLTLQDLIKVNKSLQVTDSLTLQDFIQKVGEVLLNKTKLDKAKLDKAKRDK